MQTCFEILGLTQNVTQKDLKRAYFSQVRLHPPEKEPEAFQKIRVAYEEATNALEMDIPVFARSDNPNEYRFEEDVLTHKDYPSEAARLCKLGLQKYPQNKFLLYHQCYYLRKSNQGTNAIKSAEKLLRTDPENHHYQMELALCYIRQGWTKKALDLCKKIVEKGTRNAEFLLGYSELLIQYNDYERIYDVLYKLISENEVQNAEHLAKLTDACIELVAASANLSDKVKQEEAAQVLSEFIRKNQNLLGNNPVAAMCKRLHRKMSESPSTQIRVYQQAIKSIESLASTGKEASQVGQVVGSFDLDKLMKDTRLPSCAHILYRAYVLTPELHPNAVKIDARLCGIMQRQELLACKNILKKDYPDLFSKIQPFLRSIATQEKADALKEELLERYEEYDADYFPNRKRYYYELYPDEMPEWMEDDDDDYDDDDDDFYHYFFGDDDDDDDDYDEFDDPFLSFLREMAKRQGLNFPF